MDNRYKYPEQKFAQARRYLMLPTRQKENGIILEVLNECQVGLNELPTDDLDEKTQDNIAKLKELIGKKKLTPADKQELCETINYLAYYFHDRWTCVWD